MSASRTAQLALRRLGGQVAIAQFRPPAALVVASAAALGEQRLTAGGHRSSSSTAGVKDSPCERGGWRHRPTTYEGSCEDSVWANSRTSCGFSRSTFVTERRCTGGELRDRYEIGEELGAGATSKVYRAVKRRTGEDVAVKIMSKSLVNDHQMLQNEIQIHKATDHPNILRLLEVFEDDANLYLVTEICRGGDLGKVMSLTSDDYSAVVMSEDDATRLLQQIVNSVHYLHSQGIVHRDLKPSNFLVASSTVGSSAGIEATSSKRILKLADFGVSAYCGEKHRLTRRVGTDGFMAPEVSRNLPYDEKADIFSIGCILHMMLTGHPPKEKECGTYVTSKIRLRFVSPELRSLVERCMEIDPEKRPSAQEIDELPLLKRMREKDWVNSARLDAQLLDQMYSYSSFPLLKKAALVAMVSRAESDGQFPSCIEKFMSLAGANKQGVSAEDIYKALSDELVSDMERKAHRLLNEPSVNERARPSSDSTSAVKPRRRQRSSVARLLPGAARECKARFAAELSAVAEELLNKISVDTNPLISYSEWLAATVNASWYTDSRRIQATFRLFDADGDGVISQDDLKRVMPNAFKHLDVREVLLESQHCPTQSGSGVREKDFTLLLRTHKPSKYTLQKIRDGVEDPLLPS